MGQGSARTREPEVERVEAGHRGTAPEVRQCWLSQEVRAVGRTAHARPHQEHGADWHAWLGKGLSGRLVPPPPRESREETPTETDAPDTEMLQGLSFLIACACPVPAARPMLLGRPATPAQDVPHNL